jgi:hypothetical protein
MGALAGLVALALAAAAGTPPAAAQAVGQPPLGHPTTSGPADAATLQAALRAWFATLLLPALKLPELPLSVTADADGFLLSLPVDPRAGAAQTITAHLRPLTAGRWAMEKLHVPARGSITLDPAIGLDTAVAYTIGEQTARALIDVALTGRSSVNLDLRDVTLMMRIDGEDQTHSFERYHVHGTLIPAADGRLDIVQEATVTGWESTTAMGRADPAETEVRRGRIGMRADGVRGERLVSAFAAIKGLIAEGQAGNLPDRDAKALPPAMRRHARTLIESLRDLATRVEAEETLDDFSMTIPGLGGFELEQLRIAMGGEAPDGKLRAWAEIEISGLDIDGLPKSMRDYVPSRIALRPVLTGISTERVFALLLHAIEDQPDEDRLTAETTALLTTGGASIGVESLSVDLDPLRIEGSGRMRMLTPDKAGIEARISAVGLEAIMADAGKNADLRMIMPVLAMIRGLGRQEGGKTVWDLAITDDQVLVNGVDMLATQAPADPPPQRRPERR